MRSRRTPTKQDWAIVDALVAGNRTHQDIAIANGVSRNLISRIVNGKARTYLQPVIRMRQKERKMAAANLATRWLGGVMGKHIREGVTGTGETARKCREYVMKNALFDADDVDLPKPEPKPAAAMAELSPELKRRVLKELGGPGEFDSQCDESDV